MPLEEKFKQLYNEYKDKKTAHFQKLEENKQNNLKTKYQIIEEIKELVNREESLDKTFKEFHELQTKWRDTGLVPQANVKDLWESYHHNVEMFYDYIKINKELRDLDLKKNQESKITLCEKAEGLLLENNIIKAFKSLQVFHDQWREIGPVPQEHREEIWERFKDATSKINKKHQEFFVNLKEEQKNNLDQKEALCAKAEELSNSEISGFENWDKKSNEIIELQKVWKTIGFAPKKENNKVYERFRAACDKFFNLKREFFSEIREHQNNNLQLKTDLCMQAESLKDSTEWKKTTDDLIALQKRWKEIGPVPKKHSDLIWKRFRAACDAFFNNKSNYFSHIDEEYEENLKKKEELIVQVENFEFSGDVDENFDRLKQIQRQWTDIGFVPIKKKEEIQKRFREAINVKFDRLRISEDEKSDIKFRSKLEDLGTKPRGNFRMKQDREKMILKIKQLESDITLWENNIGFFANSKNAQSMIAEVEKK
ncbi:MAG: DUF349 domain-containing protein [Bacteroidales bacterium]|nr:DUF349 domain-containing protein [Bacteroidales bacterium]